MSKLVACYIAIISLTPIGILITLFASTQSSNKAMNLIDGERWSLVKGRGEMELCIGEGGGRALYRGGRRGGGDGALYRGGRRGEMESCTGERGGKQRRAAVVPYGHNFRPSATALPATHTHNSEQIVNVLVYPCWLLPASLIASDTISQTDLSQATSDPHQPLSNMDAGLQ